MRWAAAAALVCTAAAAGATIREWRGRASSPVPSPSLAASPPRGSRGLAAVGLSAEVPAGAPAIAVAVAEKRLEPVAPRGGEPAAPANRVGPRAALSDELRLLAPAREAVARRDFGGALAAISEHARRFREGRLVEEREALRVKALVGLGNLKEARAASAEFRRRFPRSALLPVILPVTAGSRDGE